MRSYHVNENYFGLLDSEILRYRHTEILLLYYKDMRFEKVGIESYSFKYD